MNEEIQKVEQPKQKEEAFSQINQKSFLVIYKVTFRFIKNPFWLSSYCLQSLLRFAAF